MDFTADHGARHEHRPNDERDPADTGQNRDQDEEEVIVEDREAIREDIRAEEILQKEIWELEREVEELERERARRHPRS